MAKRNGTVRGGAKRGEVKGVAEVNCVICGERVTKRSTFLTDAGRVCRSHDYSPSQRALWEAQRRQGYILTLVREAHMATA
jgi:hypothetical protein